MSPPRNCSWGGTTCRTGSAGGRLSRLRRLPCRKRGAASPPLFGLPVGTSGVPSGQTGLNGGGEQYRAAVTAFQKHLQQSAGEVCVSDCKFSRILGPVHASQVDHEICLFAVVRQGLCRSIPRTQENFLDLQRGPGPVSVILDGGKALRQIFPTNPFAPVISTFISKFLRTASASEEAASFPPHSAGVYCERYTARFYRTPDFPY